jgi:uncharacterized protein YukE
MVGVIPVEMEGLAMDELGPIHIDLPLLKQIAAACRASSETLDGEAHKMRAQVGQLQEAVQGVPRIAAEEQLDQLNQALARLSSTLEDSNTYISNMVLRVENMLRAFIEGQ